MPKLSTVVPLHYFLLGTFFCLPAGAVDPLQLCARVYRELRLPDSAFAELRRDEINSVLPELVALTVVDMAEQLAKDVPANSAGGRYGPLVAGSNNPNARIVEVRKRDGTGDDAATLVTPPGFGTETIWAEMEAPGRSALARALEGQFRKGQYDHALVSDPLELRQALVEQFPLGETVGFSPLLVLNAARQRKNAGICRLGACAFAGLLIELGTPPSDLRLVSGTNHKGERHRWVEVRTGSDQPWEVFDPTPVSPPNTPSANLILALGEGRKNLREIFPNEIIESPPIAEPDPHDQVDSAFLTRLMERLKKRPS